MNLIRWTHLIRSLIMILPACRSSVMHTGVRSGSAEDASHADHASWSTEQREWRPSHVTDLKVMGMDRIRGALVGYNQRTGKVLSQQPIHERPSRITYTEGVLLDARECTALRRVNGQFEWSEPTGQRMQLWEAEANSGWTSEISSYTMRNRNVGHYCRCDVGRVQGVWRDTAVRELTSIGCRVWDKFKELDPGHQVRIREDHEPDKDERERECDDLTRMLGNRQWFFGNYDNVDHYSCPGTVAHAMRSLENRPRLRGLTQLPRAPRARVMADIKHAARVMDTVEASLGVLMTSMEMICDSFRSALRDHLPRLHNHKMLTEHERLAYINAMAFRSHEPIHYNYVATCDSNASMLVEAALTTRDVSLTPETSNVTRVAMEYGKYAEEHMTCTERKLRHIGRAVECAGQWFEIQSDRPEPTAATEGDVVAALMEIRGSLSPRKLASIYKEGRTSDDLADDLVRSVVSASETFFRRAVGVFSVYENLVMAWQRYDGIEVESGLLEDIWCCFAVTLISDDRFPRCLHRDVRLIRREIIAHEAELIAKKQEKQHTT